MDNKGLICFLALHAALVTLVTPAEVAAERQSHQMHGHRCKDYENNYIETRSQNCSHSPSFRSKKVGQRVKVKMIQDCTPYYVRYYEGTWHRTPTGRQCQRWDSQTPHSHVNNERWKFPIDDSVIEAQNYCRTTAVSFDVIQRTQM